MNIICRKIVSGEAVSSNDVIEFLGGLTPLDRSHSCLALAQAYLSVGNRRRAKDLVHRAWILSGYSINLLDIYLQINIAENDIEAVRAALKRAGKDCAKRGRVSEALALFNRWMYAYATFQGADRYEYDDEILGVVQKLAAPNEFQLQVGRPIANERLRVAHLMFGVTQFNSVIVKISKLFARYHDKSRIEPAFFIPDNEGAVKNCPQAVDAVQFIGDQGCLVSIAPDSSSEEESIFRLAKNIYEFRPHVLILNAGLADFRHYYIASMKPAPITIGFVSGPPAQFIPPDLCHAIAWTWHALMDTPVDCSHVPLEVNLPEINNCKPISRKELGLPEDAVVLGSGGRHLKFQDSIFWGLIHQLLKRHENVWFLAVGVTRDQISSHVINLDGEIIDRIIFVPWIENYLNVLAAAEILLDTFPSGGGVVIQDMAALGRPVVTFDNDYLKSFDQTNWNPAREYLPDCELIIPRMDMLKYVEVVDKLITDKIYRHEMGEMCRAHLIQYFGRPERMVKRCEDVIIESAMTMLDSVSSVESFKSERKSISPLFSVMVPTYNQASFLPKALDSLLSQTYSNWEAIVVNDGSTDNTQKILEEYASRDSRIRVFNKSNGGTVSALNEALRHVNGDWICWLSSDDFFESEKLSVHVNEIESNPDVGFFYTDYYLLNDVTGVRSLSPYDRDKFYPKGFDRIIKLLRCNYVNGITVSIRRDIMDRVGFFNPMYRAGQDFDMWLRVSSVSKSKYIDRKLSTTRMHPGQDTVKYGLAGILDSGVSGVDFLNNNKFSKLFPDIDLSFRENALTALQEVVNAVFDSSGYVRLCGFGLPLIDRTVEWLNECGLGNFVDEFVSWASKRISDGIVDAVGKELLSELINQIGKDFVYRPYDSLVLLKIRSDEYAASGDIARRDALVAYINSAQIKLSAMLR